MEHFTFEDYNIFVDVKRILASKQEVSSLKGSAMIFWRMQSAERRLLGRGCLLERMEWLTVTVTKAGSDSMKDVTSSSLLPSVMEKMKSSNSTLNHPQHQEDIFWKKEFNIIFHVLKILANLPFFLTGECLERQEQLVLKWQVKYLIKTQKGCINSKGWINFI